MATGSNFRDVIRRARQDAQKKQRPSSPEPVADAAEEFEARWREQNPSLPPVVVTAEAPAPAPFNPIFDAAGPAPTPERVILEKTLPNRTVSAAAPSMAEVGRARRRGLAQSITDVGFNTARQMAGITERFAEPGRNAASAAIPAKFLDEALRKHGTRPEKMAPVATAKLKAAQTAAEGRYQEGIQPETSGEETVARIAGNIAGTGAEFMVGGGLLAKALGTATLGTAALSTVPVNLLMSGDPELSSAQFMGDVLEKKAPGISNLLKRAANNKLGAFAVEEALDLGGLGLFAGLSRIGKTIKGHPGLSTLDLHGVDKMPEAQAKTSMLARALSPERTMEMGAGLEPGQINRMAGYPRGAPIRSHPEGVSMVGVGMGDTGPQGPWSSGPRQGPLTAEQAQARAAREPSPARQVVEQANVVNQQKEAAAQAPIIQAEREAAEAERQQRLNRAATLMQQDRLTAAEAEGMSVDDLDARARGIQARESQVAIEILGEEAGRRYTAAIERLGSGRKIPPREKEKLMATIEQVESSLQPEELAILRGEGMDEYLSPAEIWQIHDEKQAARDAGRTVATKAKPAEPEKPQERRSLSEENAALRKAYDAVAAEMRNEPNARREDILSAARARLEEERTAKAAAPVQPPEPPKIERVVQKNGKPVFRVGDLEYTRKKDAQAAIEAIGRGEEPRGPKYADMDDDELIDYWREVGERVEAASAGEMGAAGWTFDAGSHGVFRPGPAVTAMNRDTKILPVLEEELTRRGIQTEGAYQGNWTEAADGLKEQAAERAGMRATEPEADMSWEFGPDGNPVPAAGLPEPKAAERPIMQNLAVHGKTVTDRRLGGKKKVFSTTAAGGRTLAQHEDQAVLKRALPRIQEIADEWNLHDKGKLDEIPTQARTQIEVALADAEANKGKRLTPAPVAAPAAAAPGPVVRPPTAEPWQMSREEWGRRAEPHVLPDSYEPLNQIARRANRKPFNPDLITDEAVEKLRKEGLLSGRKDLKLTQKGAGQLREWRNQAHENLMAAGDAADAHGDLVEQAIKEGKPVPQSVLDDYPNLAAAATPGAGERAAVGAAAGAIAGEQDPEKDHRQIPSWLVGAALVGTGLAVSPIIGRKASNKVSQYANNPAFKAVVSQISFSPRDIPKTAFGTKVNRLYQSIFNEYHAAEEFGKMFSRPDIAWASSQARGWVGAATSRIKTELAPILVAIRNDPDVTMQDVAALLASERALELDASGLFGEKLAKATLQEHQDVVNTLGQNHAVGRYADEVRNIYRRMLDDRLANGVISQGQYNAYVGRGVYYIPFVREAEGSRPPVGIFGASGGKGYNASTGVRKFRTREGSEKSIIDPFRMAINDAFSVERDIARQRIFNIVSRIVEADPKAAEPFIRKIPQPTKNTAGIIDGHYIAANVGGERQWYNVVDDDLYNALSSLNPEAQGVGMRILEWGKKALQYGVTTMPAFQIANAIRDNMFTVLTAPVTPRSLALSAGLGAAGATYGAATGENGKDKAVRALEFGVGGAGMGHMVPHITRTLEAMRGIFTGAEAGVAGGVIGGTTGFMTADDDASFGEKATRAAVGAGAGYATGRGAIAASDRFFGGQQARDVYHEWMRNGGAGSGWFPRDQRSAAQLARQLEHDGVHVSDIVNPRSWWEAIQMVGRAVEEAPRLSRYKSALAEGASVPEAINRSRDLSVDFSRRGGSRGVKNAGKAAAFWNPKIQGMDKLIRMMDPRKTEGRKAWAIGAAAITAPSLALWSINKDNPNYQARPQYEKALYWHVPKIGGPTDSEGNPTEFWKLPKPFEIGFIFASIPESFANYLWLKSENDPLARQRLEDSLGQMGSNVAQGIVPIPTEAVPLIENVANHSFFRNRDLVPDRLQRRPTTEQFDNRTSFLSIALAQGAAEGNRMLRERGAPAILPEISPIKTDNFIRGVTGTMGEMGLRATTDAARAAGIDQRPVDPNENRSQFARFSTRDNTMTDDAAQVYKRIQKAEKAYSAISQVAKDEGEDSPTVDRLVERYKNDLILYARIHKGGDLRGAFKDFETATQGRKDIINSRDISSDEKKRLLAELRQEEQRLAQEIIRALDTQ